MFAPSQCDVGIARERRRSLHGDAHRHIIFPFCLGNEPSLYEDGLRVKYDLVAEQEGLVNIYSAAQHSGLNRLTLNEKRLKQDLDLRRAFVGFGRINDLPRA